LHGQGGGGERGTTTAACPTLFFFSFPVTIGGHIQERHVTVGVRPPGATGEAVAVKVTE